MPSASAFLTNRLKIFERPELGMNRLVAALLRADRPRAARDRRLAAVTTLFFPLRCVRPIGWIGGR